MIETLGPWNAPPRVYNKSPMDVVFCGTPAWATPILEALAASRHRLRGVVTAPDAPAGRSLHLRPPPVKEAAQRLQLTPILQPRTLKDAAARDQIMALAPDALVVAAYGRILPGRLVDAPRFGAINVHFSLLPRHRGASPVQYTLLAGDRVTGVTTMLLIRELDAGPILRQKSIEVAPRDTAATLGRRLAQEGAPLLLETLDLLEQGLLTPQVQDHSLATWAPSLAREDGLVRWERPADDLDRRVRAFDPWPPVVCRGPKGALRLLDVEARSDRAPSDAASGLVLARAGEAVDVVAGGATVARVTRLQPENGRPMSGAAALAGRLIAIGERLRDGAGP